MTLALPIRKLDQALNVRQVSKHWYIGHATIDGRRNTFFARTAGELLFKYRAAKLKTISSQFFPTQRVRYSASSGQPHDGRIYTIAMMGTQGDGTPVAWLQGKPGCVPLDRLTPVLYVEDLPA